MSKNPERKGGQRKRTMRCATYTRKSHEEGLEQDFNSLQAQREACEAFVLSQRGEGWKALPTRYDDGGFSGGTMERPGLEQLLTDVHAGRIDVVVVYKVDRLTRVLSDFARMVDIFDAHGVSFVSVTQQFNTTSSMGRLTLNVLLSFAQFEREVTGERIRDKIAASKKKGMWMGGLAPLGYDSADRKLIINRAEAETVRSIFQKYVEVGSVRRLKEKLDAEGVVSKIRVARNGMQSGGNPIAPGALYKILNNRVYIGETVHRENRYPGEHEAILDQEIWDKVQKMLAEGRVARKNGAGAKRPSLLAGLLYDDRGERMSPSHAVKQGRRYRYYVSRSLLTKTKAAGGLRIPAGDIELIVTDRLRAFLSTPAEVFDAIQPHIRAAAEQKRLLDLAASLAKEWLEFRQTKARGLILGLIPRIVVRREEVEIHLLPSRLVDVLQGDYPNLPPGYESRPKEQCLILNIPARLKRRGIEMKMIINGSGLGGPRYPDPALVRVLVQAHAMKEKLVNGGGASLRQIAKREKLEGSYLTRLIRLTFLAPDITKAILEGRHPTELTAARLMRDTRFPLDWKEQRRILGFAGPNLQPSR